MTFTLPVVGDTTNAWGTVLNEWLEGNVSAIFNAQGYGALGNGFYGTAGTLSGSTLTDTSNDFVPAPVAGQICTVFQAGPVNTIQVLDINTVTTGIVGSAVTAIKFAALQAVNVGDSVSMIDGANTVSFTVSVGVAANTTGTITVTSPTGATAATYTAGASTLVDNTSITLQSQTLVTTIASVTGSGTSTSIGLTAAPSNTPTAGTVQYCYGGTAAGTSPDSAALQTVIGMAAGTMAGPASGKVVVPPGVYLLTTPVVGPLCTGSVTLDISGCVFVAAASLASMFTLSSSCKVISSSSTLLNRNGLATGGFKLWTQFQNMGSVTQHASIIAGTANVNFNNTPGVPVPAAGNVFSLNDAVASSTSGVGPLTTTVVSYQASRTDSTGVSYTSGSATISDTSILAADQGRWVQPGASGGVTIPAASYVGVVTAGVSFVLTSQPTPGGTNVTPTGAGTGTTITLGPQAVVNATATISSAPQGVDSASILKSAYWGTAFNVIRGSMEGTLRVINSPINGAASGGSDLDFSDITKCANFQIDDLYLFSSSGGGFNVNEESINIAGVNRIWAYGLHANFVGINGGRCGPQFYSFNYLYLFGLQIDLGLATDIHSGLVFGGAFGKQRVFAAGVRVTDPNGLGFRIVCQAAYIQAVGWDLPLGTHVELNGIANNQIFLADASCSFGGGLAIENLPMGLLSLGGAHLYPYWSGGNPNTGSPNGFVVNLSGQTTSTGQLVANGVIWDCDIPVATLSQQITNAGGALTSLPVNPMTFPMPAGTFIVTSPLDGGTQTWTAAGSTLAGATGITVNSQTPSETFPIGSIIQFQAQEPLLFSFAGGTNWQAQIIGGTILGAPAAPTLNNNGTFAGAVAGLGNYNGVVLTSAAFSPVLAIPATTTVYQNVSGAQATVSVNFTTTTAAGTCTADIGASSSPATVYAISTPAITACVQNMQIIVPPQWYCKFTFTNCTAGTAIITV